MSQSNTIERDWTTAAGLRAIVLLTRLGHRCGYVGVPKAHPLHGAPYDAPCAALAPIADDTPIGKRGLLTVFGLACNDTQDRRRTPAVVFDVHGGLTYSGGDRGYPVVGDEWWLGFDCAHADDDPRFGGTPKTVEYVTAECELLASQIVEAVRAPQIGGAA